MSNKGYDFSGVTVLVVDDSRYMRKIVRILLQGLGVRNVIEAEDGVDAFREFRTRSVDIILVDWEMPILDGIEFIRMVRSSSDSPNPFVSMIMLSGHSEFKRIVEARDAGVNEYVVKPLSAQTLYTRLVSIIEKPRPFVRTKQFFGPDRRRKISDKFGGNERRSEMVEKLKELGADALGQSDIDGIMAKT